MDINLFYACASLEAPVTFSWVYAKAELNPILARWDLTAKVETVSLDCAACARPTKCCDFQPFVANFLLGAILERTGTLPALGDGVVETALGWVASATFRERFASGAREHLRCAFLGGGRCTIWWARPGECSTYLCGPTSTSRLELSARAYRLETAVAQMALATLGFSPREIARQVDILNAPGEEASEAHVKDTYRAAWAWAKTLEAKDVRAFMEDS